MAARALKGADLCRPCERQQLSRVQIPAGVQAPNSIPKCGYIEDAQLLKSTVAGEVVDVAIGKRKGKRCILVFFGESGSGKTLQSQLAPALKLLRNNSCIVRVFSKTIDDDDPILDNIRRLHQQ